jgi:tetratricopeptide (TPR) repeat protein
VFQDHVIVSRGLLNPPATLLHLVVHLCVITAALLLRRKFALPALAVLFFYAGHLVESTTLNLELYFEHRNYMPAAFLFVPLVAAVREHTRTTMFVVIAGVTLLVLGSFTRYSSSVWSNYASIVEASAQKAPMSTRAQSELAKLLFNNNRFDEAIAVIDDAIQRHQETRPQLVLTRLIILCKLTSLDDNELRRATTGLSGVMYDRRLLGIYEEFVLSVINGDCPRTSPDAVHGMFESFLAYPMNAERNSERFAQIQYFMGLLDSRSARVERAVQEFEESLQAHPSVSGALNIAAVFATGHHYPEALMFVDKARELLEQGSSNAGGPLAYSESDIDDLESTILDSQKSRTRENSVESGSVSAPGST